MATKLLNSHKIYHNGPKYSKQPKIIYQHFIFQSPIKYTQTVIFRTKIHHLATMGSMLKLAIILANILTSLTHTLPLSASYQISCLPRGRYRRGFTVTGLAEFIMSDNVAANLIPDTVAPEAINRVRIQKPDFFTSSV
jgi:hypothetical protein